MSPAIATTSVISASSARAACSSAAPRASTTSRQPRAARARSTYVAVSSADEAAAKAWHAGARMLLEPSDVVDAGRTATLADPSGAKVSLWEARRHKGAGRVNEPSTWNWSNLETTDVATSKAFYGEVFGWEFDDVPFEERASVM